MGKYDNDDYEDDDDRGQAKNAKRKSPCAEYDDEEDEDDRDRAKSPKRRPCVQNMTTKKMKTATVPKVPNASPCAEYDDEEEDEDDYEERPKKKRRPEEKATSGALTVQQFAVKWGSLHLVGRLYWSMIFGLVRCNRWSRSTARVPVSRSDLCKSWSVRCRRRDCWCHWDHASHPGWRDRTAENTRDGR